MGKFRGEPEIFSRKRGGNVKVYFQNEGERDFFLKWWHRKKNTGKKWGEKGKKKTSEGKIFIYDKVKTQKLFSC